MLKSSSDLDPLLNIFKIALITFSWTKTCVL
jgi:hypothetical protein